METAVAEDCAAGIEEVAAVAGAADTGAVAAAAVALHSKVSQTPC